MPALKIATILPEPFLSWEHNASYHMCLAHLMHVPEYGQFFLNQAQNGRFVLMDNGVVETGQPLPFEELLCIARAFNVTQMTLPDRIRDQRATLHMHRAAIESTKGRHPSFMAIPQGRNLDEWVFCAKELIRWADAGADIRAIGVTKFLEGMVTQRSDAILKAGLLDSGLEIHLLGTLANDPREIYRSHKACGCQLRGTDSGMASIWTQEGLVVGHAPRPKVEMDFMLNGLVPEAFDEALLRGNITRWKRAVSEGRYDG
jgi:hypothetical protein